MRDLRLKREWLEAAFNARMLAHQAKLGAGSN